MEIHDALPLHEEKELKSDSTEAVPSGLKNRDFNLKTAELIRSQIGDIEEIRRGLGLSKRKMCQLLLIDPSTWTRWTTGKTTPPPYVYRMLQWGLAVMDKYPETHPLVQYEKFEQVKKIESLSDRLDKVEGVKKSSNKEVVKATPLYNKTLLISASLFGLSLLLFVASL